MAAEKSLVLNSSADKSTLKSYSKLVDVVIIAFSICTLLVDLATDIFLVAEYTAEGFYPWAGLTLALVVLPTLIVEVFSIRWHSLDGNATRTAWVAHFLCLGIAHRYLEAIKTAAIGTSQTLLQQQRDLCLLHLFNSFLESAPQLVLQLYVTASLGSLLPWTGISLVASLFSLAWAIASYTRAMRLSRPDKKPASGAALAFQAMWRAGTLTARIVSLSIFALVSPMWMLFAIILHWALMTAWAISQRTDFCETWWEERAYNAVVGVVYCFCFFNLQEGPSRTRAALYYLLVTAENVACLVAFAVWGDVTPLPLAPTHLGVVKLLVLIVSLSTLIGLSSMLLYYAFFHPAGVIFPCMPKDDCEARQTLSDDVGRNTLRSLRHEPTNSPDASPQRPPSSVASVTLSSLESSPTVSEKQPPILEISSINSSPESSLSASQKLKRRPICDISLSELDAPSPPSSPTPQSPSPEPPPLPLSRANVEEKDEVSSTCPSAHDYENMCAVGITRELWGLRHWDGYSSDIAEHDSSVARGLRDPRRDTLVSTSTYSSLSESNYSDSESDTYTYVRTLGMPLTPIAEEDEPPPPQPPHASCSSLVLTIDEIRLSNPDLYASTEVLDESVDGEADWAWQPLSQTEINFLAQLKPPDELNQPKQPPPNRLRRKFSLLRDRFELGPVEEEDKDAAVSQRRWDGLTAGDKTVTLVPVAS